MKSRTRTLFSSETGKASSPTVRSKTEEREATYQDDPRLGGIAVLDRLLADTAILSFQALSMHWNYSGPEFLAYHTFFEKRYQRLVRAIDRVAERIRALGALAPAGFSEWMELSDLEDIPLAAFERMPAKPSINPPSETVSAISLYLEAEELVRDYLMRTALPRIQELDDPVTQDILVSRLNDHEKTIWIINSLLGRPVIRSEEYERKPREAA